MTFREKLERIDELQAEIMRHGQLPLDVLGKIKFKFRLEWNYHSNSMEGNALTRQETRSVMAENITVNGKPIRDVYEMHQHDELITKIIQMGKGDIAISERRIKEIHAAIMYEEDPEKSKLLGVWKKTPNYLFNYKGERFDFAPPDEVAERMHRLIDWLNAEKEKLQGGKKDALHPVVLASRFHLDYVTIHPFYDGNGRTARILTNIILIACGYPPIYVRTDEREIYGRYLTDIQANVDNPDVFYEFMARCMIRSQALVLDAIAGKEIDEPDDLDKKLFLLEKRLETFDPQNEITKRLNTEIFEEIYDSWLVVLIERSIVMIQKFNKFFNEHSHYISIPTTDIYLQFDGEGVGSIMSRLSEKLTASRPSLNTPEIKFLFRAAFGTFKKGGLKSFGCNYGWEVKFEKIKYVISVDEFSGNDVRQTKVVTEKLLHQSLSDAEIDEMIRSFGETIYTHIVEHARNIGIDLI